MSEVEDVGSGARARETLRLAIDLSASATNQKERYAALNAVAAAEEASYRRDSVGRQLELRARGQLYGFIITLLWLIGAVVIGVYTNPWAATLFGSVDLVPLVAIFVLSRQPTSSPQHQIEPAPKPAGVEIQEVAIETAE